MLKSLLVFILLSVWYKFADSFSCIVFVLYILVFTTLLTISISEIKIIRKYVVADSIFYQNSSLFSIVKSAWITVFLSLIIAFFASVLLLLSTLYLNSVIFVILGLDVVVIWFIYTQTRKRLSLKVKGAFLDAVSRRWSSWINTFLLLVVFVIYQFFATPSYEIQKFSCEIINFLSSVLKHKELLEWKFMSLSIGSFMKDDGFIAWFFYLFISQGIFAWSYSKLLLSPLIPKSIIYKDKDKNYFILGFFITIVILFIISMTINYLYEKEHIQRVQLQMDEAYKQIDKNINLKLNSSEQLLIDDINKVIDKEVEMVFKPVYRSIPQLSEYYYSIKGEYSRIALKGYSLYCGYKNDYLAPYYNQYLPNRYKLKRCNSQMLDDEIQSKINLYLFEQNDFSQRVDSASSVINASIKDSMSGFQKELSEDLNLLEAKHNIKLDSLELNFDKIFEASLRDVSKKGLSATGTVLISGAISKSIVSKMLLKFGAKGLAKASTFIGGSVAGLSICAPSGPWALLCGVVTGTASWVGVDAALTEVDQAFNEEDFQLSVEMMIDAQKNSFKELMKDSYREWIQGVFVNLKKDTDALKSPYEQLY